MSAERIAKLIPAEYRKEILAMGMIDSARANIMTAKKFEQESMNYLATIWKNYIEPTFTPDCPLCYSRVLKNFQNMKAVLIRLEEESKKSDHGS